MSFFSKIIGNANDRYLQSARLLVAEINQLESVFEKLTAEEVKKKTAEFKEQLTKGKTLAEILPPAFALVRETAKRTLGQRHYDVQLIGGIALHQGKIAEMRTGEGKTLVATLPVYLNALAGRGVHVVTVNDYLSRRDAVWMGQIYDYLGLTVGVINHEASYLYDQTQGKISHNQPSIPRDQNDNLDQARDSLGSFKIVHEFLRPVTRKEAYAADVTYGTNNEFGFDYLRDHMVYETPQQVQAGRHFFAIVDEVDSILIDEARTPLIISAPDADSTKLYETFAQLTPRLRENEDYNIDEKLKAATLTEAGIEKMEKALGVKNIYEEGGWRYVHHLEQALRAQALFKRDRDYVVKNGEVVIVDEFTGRLMPGRRWSEGLHQAVEAKEGALVQKESRTLATITFQNYFRFYQKLAGMTGTALTSAEEFHKVYNLEVIAVPTYRPMIRRDLTDQIYKTAAGKWRAVTREIKERHQRGQPVLVGTVSIEKNEMLSSLLNHEGISHQILNAKNHEKEAEIIAQAGRWGAVTVATNMAGRGVDIMLGGYPPSKLEINKENLSSGESTEKYQTWEKEYKKVIAAGGLHVMGTERHEARRIDNQLRGRSGRQGDPGSSQFFISTEDDLARIFGGERLKNLLDTLGVGEDEVIENRFISKAIEAAQTKIEGHHFDARKYILEYDDVMNRHRTAIYDLRQEILTGSSNQLLVAEYRQWLIERLVETHLRLEREEDYEKTITANRQEISESLKALMGKNLSWSEELDLLLRAGEQTRLTEELKKIVEQEYAAKEKEMGAEAMRRLEKLVLLRVIDELWVDHLEQMDYLKESVRLRAYGQRDPLVEYRIEGQKMFEQLKQTIKGQVANLIFKVSFRPGPQEMKTEEGKKDTGGQISRSLAPNLGQISNFNDQNSKKIGPSSRSVGRNDPCPCESGKKYKKCHGA